MRWLVRAFPGRTYQIVVNLMHWPIYKYLCHMLARFNNRFTQLLQDTFKALKVFLGWYLVINK